MIEEVPVVTMVWSDEDLMPRTSIVVHGVPVETRTDHEMYLSVDAPRINTMFTGHYEALWWWLDQETPD